MGSTESMMDGAIWTSRDGRQIPIWSLGDDHLRNIIWRLLRFTAFRKPIDAATYGGYINQLDEEDYAAAIHPHFIDLVKEAMKRRLDLSDEHQLRRREQMRLFAQAVLKGATKEELVHG